MAYRNGTYIAFHANGTAEPTESDMKYYNLLRAWRVRNDDDFRFINSHDKTGAVRDSSKRETLQMALRERLNNSKNMILIIGRTTSEDTDWVPFEIAHAIDRCRIPIFAAYTQYTRVLDSSGLRGLWPRALRERIDNGVAHVLHIPFSKAPLAHAISTFSYDRYPNGGGFGVYDLAAYQLWDRG